MIGQAWERHRRDQLLISCSPRRVAEVMNAEHHGLYRRGMHETFVMEIPLLCSDVLGYNTSVGQCARTRGHTTGTTLGPDAGWDFMVPAQRLAALKLLQNKNPYFVVMSVPSAPWMFSSVALSSRDRQRQLQQQLTTQIRFASRVARLQLGGGRHFVIEHPPASALWRLPGVRSLAADPRCRLFSIDLGRFGTKTLGGERLRLPWTRLLTSSQAVVHEFGPVRCDGPPPRRPFMEIRAFPKGFTDRLVAAMEEEFGAETCLRRAAVQANECFEVSGVGASVDFVQETLAQEAGLEGDSETEEEAETPFVGEITPAIRAAVRRVHEATGHRPPKRLARALLLSGAPPAAVQAARELKCDVCLEKSKPKARRVATLPAPRAVGERAHVDLLVVEDALGEAFVVAHATDAVSKYQLAAVIPDKSSASVIDFLTRLWWPLLGAPQQIVADQGREFISEEFQNFCSAHSVHLWHCAVQAPWQNSPAERSGGVLKTLVAALVAEHVTIGFRDMCNVVGEACSAYNADANEEGVSPRYKVLRAVNRDTKVRCYTTSPGGLPSMVSLTPSPRFSKDSL